MKIKQIIKWNWQTSWPSLAITYGILAFIFIIVSIITISSSDISGSMSGFDTTAFIYSFVVGIIMFAAPLRFGGTNGVSRKTIFLGNFCFSALLSIFMATCNMLMGAILKPLMENINIHYKELYTAFFMDGTGFSSVIAEWVLLVAFFMSCFTFGLLFGGGYYRSNKLGKILVAAGVPIALFVLLPVLISVLPAGIRDGMVRGLLQTLNFVMQSPYILAGGMLVFTAVSTGFIWLMMRHAPIKPVEVS